MGMCQICLTFMISLFFILDWGSLSFFPIKNQFVIHSGMEILILRSESTQAMEFHYFSTLFVTRLATTLLVAVGNGHASMGTRSAYTAMLVFIETQAANANHARRLTIVYRFSARPTI